MPVNSAEDVCQRCEQSCEVQAKYAGGLILQPFKAGAKLTLTPVVQNVGLKNPEIPSINAVMNIAPSTTLCFVLVFLQKII